MKIRVKFRKYGNMRFIGHLDVMRYFQKAIRRADLPIAYSTGYSPHQIMSFAAPLGLGLTSDGEYMDIEMNDSPAREEAIRLLNAQMAEGIEVTDYRVLSGDGKNAMSVVAAASYEIRCRYADKPFFTDEKLLQDFLRQESIPVEKQAKKTLMMIDLKPLVYEASLIGASPRVMSLCLATGSSRNLKPEFLLDTLAAYAGCTNEAFDYLIHRKELYGNAAPEGEKPKLIPLSEFGTLPV